MSRLSFLVHITAILVAFTTSLSAKEIPTTAFSQLPDVAGLSLSPDGKNIAAIIRLDVGEFRGKAITVYNIDSKTSKALLTSANTKNFINWISWANNNTILLSSRYAANRYGTQTTETRLLKIDIDTKKVIPTLSGSFYRKLDYIPVHQDNIVSLLPDSSSELLLALRTKPAMGTEVIRLNLKSRRTKIEERLKSNVFNWHADRQGRVRIAERFSDTTTSYLHRALDSKRWEQIYSYEELSSDEVNLLGFGNDANEVFISKYHKGKKAIFKADLSKGFNDAELVYSHPDYDVSGTLFYSKKLKSVVGLRHGFGDPITFWGSEHKKIQTTIDKALPNTDNAIVDISDDERRVILLSSSATDPGTYYLWDRDTARMEGLASRYKSLPPAALATTKPINYKARDGVDIEGFLTLPKNKGEKNLPTIVFPHGGPISHDTDGFDYWTQFFANRGYAVMQMNFRGSSGYGYDFMASGFQGWGDKMQLDVEDGTRWLIEQKTADPKRICIVGASYGGYAALMEAAAGNGLYQCAVSFAGVTDIPYLVSQYRNFNNYDLVKKMIGSDRKSLKSNSPVNLAEKINIPILLVHGDKDRVVKPRHSKKMAKALKANGKNFEYIELDKGTHYLSIEDNRMQFFDAMENFLAQHLN